VSEVKRGLGRGLSSLLGEAAREQPIGGDAAAGVRTLPVGQIVPNPDQPRRHFDEDALDELAASLKASGLIQPIVVRPKGGAYEIVAGERRWRAAQRAQLHDVPVLVRTLTDAETVELAIVENVQRQDLNSIEEAESYQRLIKEYGHTQDALGRIVGKSRSHITNLLRLLDLPPSVREAVVQGKLTMGHAKAILTSADPEALAREVIARGLSVRETEALARGPKPKRERLPEMEYKGASADIWQLQRQLADQLGLKVAIKHGPNGGIVTIDYASLDQLDMLCQRLSGEPI
jgi:ParB family chromosome partitioning protein